MVNNVANGLVAHAGDGREIKRPRSAKHKHEISRCRVFGASDEHGVVWHGRKVSFGVRGWPSEGNVLNIGRLNDRRITNTTHFGARFGDGGSECDAIGVRDVIAGVADNLRARKEWFGHVGVTAGVGVVFDIAQHHGVDVEKAAINGSVCNADEIADGFDPCCARARAFGHDHHRVLVVFGRAVAHDAGVQVSVPGGDGNEIGGVDDRVVLESGDHHGRGVD